MPYVIRKDGGFGQIVGYENGNGVFVGKGVYREWIYLSEPTLSALTNYLKGNILGLT